MNNKKDKKNTKEERKDWAARRAKSLGISRNQLLGIIALR